jgi:flotillin
VEGAQNQAKIDVAEAKMKGDIGEKQRTGLTRQEVRGHSGSFPFVRAQLASLKSPV